MYTCQARNKAGESQPIRVQVDVKCKLAYTHLNYDSDETGQWYLLAFYFFYEQITYFLSTARRPPSYLLKGFIYRNLSARYISFLMKPLSYVRISRILSIIKTVIYYS